MPTGCASSDDWLFGQGDLSDEVHQVLPIGDVVVHGSYVDPEFIGYGAHRERAVTLRPHDLERGLGDALASQGRAATSLWTATAAWPSPAISTHHEEYGRQTIRQEYLTEQVITKCTVC